MDSRKTTHEDGDERGTENVVRLPRDYLGPREELVPIGSRARALDAPDGDATEAFLPNAASFWDEDSGALQSPMQAPPDAWQPAPTERNVRPRRRRPRFERRGGDAFTSRRRASAAIAALVACALLVLAVIGRTEGTHNTGDTAASISKIAPIESGRGVNRAGSEAKTRVVTQVHSQPRNQRSTEPRHHAARPRARKHRIRVRTIHRRVRTRPNARPTNSTGEPVRTTAPTNTEPPVSSPQSGSPATTRTSSTPSASTDRSTSSSSQQQPAFGANGSLGPGSSPDS